MVGKDGGALLCGNSAFENAGEVLAVKDIVAEYQGDIVVANKVFANNKGLGQLARSIALILSSCLLRLLHHGGAIFP